MKTALLPEFRRLLKLVLKVSLALAFVVVLLPAVGSSAQTEEPEATFRNPLRPNNGADPFIVYHEGSYYLLTTTDSSELFVYRSPTLGGLHDAEPIRVWEDDTPDRCCHMWSPELHLLEGPDGPRWYLYYTAGPDSGNTRVTQRTHVLESAGEDPLGPYTYKGRVYDPKNDTAQLDPSVLEWEGELYFLHAVWDEYGESLYIASMSDPWTISGDRVRISFPSYSWEEAGANSNEAPAALKHDGDLFLVYSAGTCASPDYKLGMLIFDGDDVLDPEAWVKHPEPVFHWSDENSAYGTGHSGFFKSPDGTEDWIVYHANDSLAGGCDDQRTTRAQPITWTEDGLPDFGEPVSLDTELLVPSGEVPPAM